MLKIWFRRHDRAPLPIADKLTYWPGKWFDNIYEDEWLYDPFVIDMVRGVDQSELVGQNVISPFLGSISVLNLSSGVKSLICLYKEGNKSGHVWDMMSCGDNCCYWLERIGERVDVEMHLSHIPRGFSENFTFECMNVGKVYHSVDDYFDCAYMIMLEGNVPD